MVSFLRRQPFTKTTFLGNKKVTLFGAVIGIRAGRDTGIVVRLMSGQLDDGSKREPGWNIGVTSCLAAPSDGTEDMEYLALGYEGARSQALGYGSID